MNIDDFEENVNFDIFALLDSGQIVNVKYYGNLSLHCCYDIDICNNIDKNIPHQIKPIK